MARDLSAEVTDASCGRAGCAPWRRTPWRVFTVMGRSEAEVRARRSGPFWRRARHRGRMPAAAGAELTGGEGSRPGAATAVRSRNAGARYAGCAARVAELRPRQARQGSGWRRRRPGGRSGPHEPGRIAVGGRNRAARGRTCAGSRRRGTGLDGCCSCGATLRAVLLALSGGWSAGAGCAEGSGALLRAARSRTHRGARAAAVMTRELSEDARAGPGGAAVRGAGRFTGAGLPARRAGRSWRPSPPA
jgi:hypothetical protein